MEYEKIKNLIEDMGNSKLSSINIEFPNGLKVSMTKEDMNNKNISNQISKNANNEEKDKSIQSEENEECKKGNIVTSPMVGTFYAKPAPNAKPYVEKGTEVKCGDTLCIIEAMKLINEIESEYTGKIAEILIEDGKTVEYGTPLFRIE